MRQELEEQVITEEMLKESEARAETPPQQRESNSRESRRSRLSNANPLAMAAAIDEKPNPSDEKQRQRRNDAILQNKARLPPSQIIRACHPPK